MKKIFIGVISIALLAACNNIHNSNNSAANATGTAPIAKPTAAPVTPENAAVMKFDNDSFDFGKINQGDKVTHEYKFTNTGKSPLVLTDGFATCGCTKPEWPKTPVKPGESGIIKVTFNSAGKSGLQDKQITLVGNTIPANTVLHLVGEVLEPKK